MATVGSVEAAEAAASEVRVAEALAPCLAERAGAPAEAAGREDPAALGAYGNVRRT